MTNLEENIFDYTTGITVFIGRFGGLVGGGIY